MAQISSLSEARARRGISPSSPTSWTDDELVHGVVAGDARVAERLYRRLKPFVRRTLRRLAGDNQADLEDLTQVAFMRILTSMKKGAFQEGANLEAWCGVIATRAGMDHLRSVYRRRSLFFLGKAHRDPVVLPGGEQAVELTEVRRALSSLKASHAEVLFLHDTMGYELSEIAQHLDISVAATQSRLVRTRKELILRLKKQEGRKK